MIINHASIELGWDNEDIIRNARVLVLGSFNPFNPQNEKKSKYYYSRKTNYFWKYIANHLDIKESELQENNKLKLEIMDTFHFCCLDIINSIEIISKNNDFNIEQDYAINNIFKNFSDNKLFVSKPRNINVQLRRNYNFTILDILKDGNFNKVIHTMGNERITQDFITKPKGLLFQKLINQIKEIHIAQVNMQLTHLILFFSQN